MLYQRKFTRLVTKEKKLVVEGNLRSYKRRGETVGDGFMAI